MNNLVRTVPIKNLIFYAITVGIIAAGSVVAAEQPNSYPGDIKESANPSPNASSTKNKNMPQNDTRNVEPQPESSTRNSDDENVTDPTRSVEQAPGDAVPSNSVSPPDPSRPWLTQADIDANRSQRAALEQQITSTASEIVALEVQLASTADEINRYRIGGPEDNLALWSHASDRHASIAAQITLKSGDLELLVFQLNNGIWY